MTFETYFKVCNKVFFLKKKNKGGDLYLAIVLGKPPYNNKNVLRVLLLVLEFFGSLEQLMARLLYKVILILRVKFFIIISFIYLLNSSSFFPNLIDYGQVCIS